MQIISLSQIPSQTFNIVLGGTASAGDTEGQYCTISIYWRQKRLYLDLYVNSVVVCQGAICQNRADLLQSKSQNFSGSLHFFDLEGDRPPQWERLHTDSTGRWVLIYLEDWEEVPLKLRY